MSTVYEFETSSPFLTKDNFRVKLKGTVVYAYEEGKLSISNLLSAIERSCKEQINKMQIYDVLELVDANITSPIATKVNEMLGSVEIDKFRIQTVDAVEMDEELDISIDPSLENQQKGRGFFNKIKSFFGF